MSTPRALAVLSSLYLLWPPEGPLGKAQSVVTCIFLKPLSSTFIFPAVLPLFAVPPGTTP